jgi:sec-independent protein translocase protein TatA
MFFFNVIVETSLIIGNDKPKFYTRDSCYPLIGLFRNVCRRRTAVMFGGIGIPELIIVLVIALIFFGPGKLPELGSSIGKAIRGFKRSMEEPGKKSEGSLEENRTGEK